eukprot:gene23358-9635_t
MLGMTENGQKQMRVDDIEQAQSIISSTVMVVTYGFGQICKDRMSSD